MMAFVYQELTWRRHDRDETPSSLSVHPVGGSRIGAGIHIKLLILLPIAFLITRSVPVALFLLFFPFRSFRNPVSEHV